MNFPLKKHLASPHQAKNTTITVNKGKGAVEQHLPSRHSLNTLTKGSLLDRTMNNYAKETPDVGGGDEDTPDAVDYASAAPGAAPDAGADSYEG